MASDSSNPGLRYELIGEFLRAQEADEIVLSLDEITTLIGATVPKDAQTPQFWANTRKYHQSRRGQWLDAGFNAFFDPNGPGVLLVLQQKGKRDLWSLNELEACVRAYRNMLRLHQRRESFSKAEWRRKVLPELSNRTEGSYEFRMQNISAVLTDLGLEILPGYLPAKNIGNVRDGIIRLINVYWERKGPEIPTDDPDQLVTRVASARQKLARDPNTVPKGIDRPQRTTSSAASFVRDPDVIGWVLNIANGLCEMCTEVAPFFRKDGEPYLEVHHLRQLSEGGPDKVDNALALCPNCHRNFHHGQDKHSLRKLALQKIKRLRDYPVVKIDKALDTN